MDILEKGKHTLDYINGNIDYLSDSFCKTMDIDKLLSAEIEHEENTYSALSEKLENTEQENKLFRYCGAVADLEFKRGFLTAVLLRDILL